MKTPFPRRHFLKLLTVVAAAPAIGGMTACSSSSSDAPAVSTPEQSDHVFPQGLASGDPKGDRIVLWTRVEPTSIAKLATDTITVHYVVATDEALTQVVAQGDVPAAPDGDHTVHLLVTALLPATKYYYRFEAGGTTTRIGHTKTAPAEGADVPVKFAFASCQDFIGRQYHAWRALLDEKADIDFVLFLGDYIYETTDDERFQTGDKSRTVTFPDGLDISKAQDRSKLAAGTLADYRTLYKTYRSDASLKEVHRLYPFITIWDDHEFADDCWQDHSTSFAELDPKTQAFTDEKNTPRRQSASRAWAEYQQADVTYDASKSFPDDLTIYRRLRYGKHVELFMTDQRLYRSDHVVPEGPVDVDVYKFTLNTNLGSRSMVRKGNSVGGFDVEEAAKKPTMLGTTQKAWFTDAVKASQATWKVWANEVQLWQMLLDLRPFTKLDAKFREVFYFTVDQWDGYRTERAEILTGLKDVSNLVVCTGDIHAFYAADLYTNFDAPTDVIAPEYVTAGISSSTLYSIIESTINSSDLLKTSGVIDVLPMLNDTLKSSNAHLKYADSEANGIAIATVNADAFNVTFLRVSSVLKAEYGGVTGRANFRTSSGKRKVEILP